MKLITGAAGFIGSHLIEELSKKEKVVGIDCFDTFLYSKELKQKNIEEIKNPNLIFYQKNILDKDFEDVFIKHKITQVIHLAARAGVRPSLRNPLSYVDYNVKATVKLLELSVKYGVKKFVFASSSSVYGNNDKIVEKFSETLETLPVSPYASTKASCEKFGYTYAFLYKIPFIALRFFTVYGPRQRPEMAIQKFIKKILNNEEITLYGEGTERDYTYVSDIVDGIIKATKHALNNKIPYEVFNLGSGNPIKLEDLIKIIEEILDKKARIKREPLQKGDVLRTYADIEKAKKLLGYSPKTNIREGIKKQVEWNFRN